MKNITWTVTVKLPSGMDWNELQEQMRLRLAKAMKEEIDRETERMVRKYLYGEGDREPVGFCRKDGDL